MEFEVGGETYEGRLNAQREDADAGVLILPGMGHGPFGDIFDVLAYELAGTGKRVFRYESWETREDLEAKTIAELHEEVDAAVEYLQSAGCSTVYLVAKSFGGGLALTHVPDAVERVVLWEPATIAVATTRTSTRRPPSRSATSRSSSSVPTTSGESTSRSESSPATASGASRASTPSASPTPSRTAR